MSSKKTIVETINNNSIQKEVSKTVSDLLTMEELVLIAKEGNYQVIALQDEKSSFRGYHPLNSFVPANYSVVRNSGQLLKMKVVAGG